MPELPEVERARRRLARAITGCTITALRPEHPALARRLSPAVRRSLAGHVVRSVTRRGKRQFIHLDDGRVLHVHFRLAGDWHIGRVGDPAARYTRAVLECVDGTRATLVDPRALSTLVVEPNEESVTAALGPDADDPRFTPAALAAALSKRRSAIKPALLDQRVVAGLGNIYAGEALWQARIDPRTPAAELRPEQLRRLVAAIRDVLAAAPRARHSAQQVAPRWRVYDRAGEPCERCGVPIRRVVQAGRSTYYCPRCQRPHKPARRTRRAGS